jgi:hypothetical protein
MRCLAGVVVIAALFPLTARAQEAGSFSKLDQALKPGQRIVLTDGEGRRVRGRVTALTPSSIAVEGRLFADANVREIRRADPLWNGALIGAGVGAGLALWDYLIDPSEPGNAAIAAVAVGLGAAAGAGIDKLIPGRLLYLSPGTTVRMMPVVSRSDTGVIVAIRF